MPPDAPVFRLRDVSKRFGAVAAVGPVSLDVGAGETTVLIGPSGCGKSTLLRLLVGLLAPTTGTVSFRGAPMSDAAALRRQLGFVVQGGGLFPHLSAVDNITLLASHLRWETSKRERRVAALCELTRFPPDGLARFPAELSGGQRQRVSLMRALMLDPDVLLLDEPLGALDPITRFDLQADLRRVFDDLRKTVVLVTHDLGEAAFFAGNVVLLRDGRVVQEGPLSALLEHPADPFVTRFVNAHRQPVDLAPGKPS
jgi:osmoprotectant transport system ATP-binding protein